MKSAEIRGVAGTFIRVRGSAGWYRAAFEGWTRGFGGKVLAQVALLDRMNCRYVCVAPDRIHPDDRAALESES